jgi:5-methylcytosine-specific restriction endonuclease McrA
MAISQSELVLKYFMDRPNQEIKHSTSKKDLEDEFERLTGKRFEDSDRTIRKLYDEGKLIKVKKGVYKYDPNIQPNIQLQDFSPETKREALERDQYKCVICGLGKADGVDLQIDHILPRSKGGDATIGNAQTLCAPHNFSKKNLSQIEHGKKMFIKLRDKTLALVESEERANLLKFYQDILKVYEKHKIDDHLD